MIVLKICSNVHRSWSPPLPAIVNRAKFSSLTIRTMICETVASKKICENFKIFGKKKLQFSIKTKYFVNSNK